MKLLSPKRANTILRRQTADLEAKAVKTVQAIDSATRKFHQTREAVAEEEEKLLIAHRDFIDQITEEVKSLTDDVNALEKRKADAMVPIDDLMEKAKSAMEQAESFKKTTEERLAKREMSIEESEKDIQRKMDKVTDMLDEIGERDFMSSERETNTKDRLSMADQILRNAETKADQDGAILSLREAKVTERERAVRDRENAVTSLESTLKAKQKSISEDRIHLQSQQAAFETAKTL